MDSQENKPVRLHDTPMLYSAVGLERPELIKAFYEFSDPAQYVQDDPCLQLILMEIRFLLAIEEGELPAATVEEAIERAKWDRERRQAELGNLTSSASPAASTD